MNGGTPRKKAAVRLIDEYVVPVPVGSVVRTARAAHAARRPLIVYV